MDLREAGGVDTFFHHPPFFSCSTHNQSALFPCPSCWYHIWTLARAIHSGTTPFGVNLSSPLCSELPKAEVETIHLKSESRPLTVPESHPLIFQMGNRLGKGSTEEGVEESGTVGLGTQQA